MVLVKLLGLDYPLVGWLLAYVYQVVQVTRPKAMQDNANDEAAFLSLPFARLKPV
uniref:Uncharacterized protein n=1 Tax=Oryza sativa subsp. japonica TaxID=39947 RepID=Q69S42_ORYSJ|nr:hypothetical protein [Oryza sativa Japonica Group]